MTVNRVTEDTSMTPSQADTTTAIASTAVYSGTLEGLWSSDVTWGGVPTGAGFTGVAGAVHDDTATFVAAGETASDGVESLVESGTTTALVAEFDAAAEGVAERLQIAGTLNPEGSATFKVSLTTDHPRITLLTRLNPSPDWFTGVSARSLLDAQGLWTRSLDTNLSPWDAGTRDGGGFDSGTGDTTPQGVTRSIRGTGPFTTEPIAELRLELESLAFSVPENSPVGTDISGPFPVADGTVSYSIGGADAESFTFQATDGRIKTKDSLDHEDRDSLEASVTVTYADAETVVTPITVHVTNVDEAGAVVVTPAPPRETVELTARVDDPDGGVTAVTWLWETSPTGEDGDWSPVSGADSATYTPTSADIDQFLRVTGTYSDAHGSDKRAQGTTEQVHVAPPPLSSDNDLSGLALGGLTLTPSFAMSRTSYAVSAPYAVAQPTITATPSDPLATVEFLDSGDNVITDADPDTGGYQVALAVGTNRIRVKVTAQNGTAQTYTILAGRARPEAGVTVAAPVLTEGDDVVFTIARSAAAADSLTVSLVVSETGAMVDAAHEGTVEVTIPASTLTRTLTVPTQGDDAWETHSQVRATITAADGYTIASGRGSGLKEVRDDDFPAAEASLGVSPVTVPEGDAVTATVTVTTDGDRQPHATAGTIQINTVPDTASASDYTPISAADGALSFAASDFARVDIQPGSGTDWRYRATRQLVVATTDDEIEEDLETFTVAMTRITTGEMQTHGRVRLGQPTSATVTVTASDLHYVTGVATTSVSTTSAVANISIQNTSGHAHTAHLRYRTSSPVGSWSDSLTQDSSTGTAVIVIRDLTANTQYDVEASLEDDYPPTRTAPLTFSTNAVDPAVTSVSVPDSTVTTTTATATVSIDGADGTSRTVRLRYRALPSGTWTPVEPGTTTTSSLTFALSGLTSGTRYQVQATLSQTFTSGVQSTSFETEPPLVVSVVAREGTLSQTGATIDVGLMEPNGDEMRLRYRTGGGAWTTQTRSAAIGTASVTFVLTDLTSGREYELEASYDAAFTRNVESLTVATLAPRVSSVVARNVTSAEAVIVVNLAAPNGDTLHVRHRTPAGDWIDHTIELVFESPAQLTLVRLTPSTAHEVEVSYDPAHPTAATQSVTFTTGQPGRRGVTSNGSPGLGFTAGPPASSGPEPSNADFHWNVSRDIDALDGANGSPTGLWSDGTTLWVADNSTGPGDAVYAYDLAGGARAEDREFKLDQTNRAPRGLWSDGEVIWVSDSGQDRLFAHDLIAGARLPDRDLELTARNGQARGIWSDGATMWVLDGQRDALFAYNLETGELLGEYDLDDANSDSHGIWSDGVTAWVSNHDPKRLFAYRLPTPLAAIVDGPAAAAMDLASGEEFTTLSRASNNSPRGIWSDGDVMYVADENDGKVYTYNMPDAIDARLASLSLSGVELGAFDGDLTEYEGVVEDGVTVTTVEAQAVQALATVEITPGDADEAADGHQITLASLEEITVTATSADESRERVYRVRLTGAIETGSAASCLRGAVAVGFSLVTFEGGTVEDLIVCAEGRHVTALYVLDDGAYVSYIVGAPEFVNAGFRALYPGGVPALTPLVAASDGPASPDASVGPDGTPDWSGCLRGEVATGFSLVLYAGGSIDELEACAESRGVAAIYLLDDGAWVSYILGAPAFVNARFQALFADGVPAATPLTVRGEAP